MYARLPRSGGLALLAVLVACGGGGGGGGGGDLPADTTPPRLVALSPEDGATAVALDAPITATFSEPMDVASLQGAFTLWLEGTKVPTSVTWSAGTLTATLVPGDVMYQGNWYEVRVGTGAKDLAGNALAEGAAAAFRTAMPPPQRQLTVGNDPAHYWMDAFGRVVDDRGKIDCGGTSSLCTAWYDQGTVVTLTATAAPAAVHTGWVGDDCYGLTGSSVTLTLDTGKGCTARFEIRQGHQVTVSVSYGPWIGRVYDDTGYVFNTDPRKVDCGPDTRLAASVCSGTFGAGLAISFRAAKVATAPAGTYRWTCTSDAMGTPGTIVADGEISPPIYMTRDKECHVDLATGP